MDKMKNHYQITIDKLHRRIEELEAEVASESKWAETYNNRVVELEAEVERLAHRVGELEANIIEADAQWDVDKKPRKIEEAELALVRCMSMGAEAMSEVERLKHEVQKLKAAQGCESCGAIGGQAHGEYCRTWEGGDA